jgi:hypothetical protein
MSVPTDEQRHRQKVIAAVLFAFVILLILALLLIGAIS